MKRPILRSGITLPNFKILSVFEVDGDNVVMIGDFAQFVDKQCKINAPGKVLTDESAWLHAICDEMGMDFAKTDGVCIGDDYGK